MIAGRRARSATLSIPGLTADYTRLPAGTGPSITAGHAIGVAFTPQRHAVWSVGGAKSRAGRLTPASVFVVPAEGLEWTAWSDVSESVEMWLDPGLLGELSELGGGPPLVQLDYHEVASDPVVVNLAALVRRSVLSGSPPGAGLEYLPLFLATHVLERYRGLRFPRSGRIRKLDRAVLARVADYIDSRLEQPLALLELAGIAEQSQYHFAKAFKAATGSSPYAYVAARRMERALVLLQQTRLPISQIARLVGFESMSHFRSRFRRAWGESTAAHRETGRPPVGQA